MAEISDLGTEHVGLAREATAAGLVVTQLMPILCRCAGTRVEYVIQLWQADGTLWAEGSHETAGRVREAIRSYAEPAAEDHA